MENAFVISYDLPEDGNYDALIERIKKYKTWAHITQSTWAIVTESTSVEIRDELIKIIGKDARLIVVQSAHVAAWNNTMCSNDWLKKNI